jgi:NTP pyrophosphatase (non-canonical NTP hydrolase)
MKRRFISKSRREQLRQKAEDHFRVAGNTEIGHMGRIDISALQQTSAERANRWHNGNMNEWNALEWAGAMAGEAGEACNAAKKLKRIEDGIPSINLADRDLRSEHDAKLAVAKECADTIIYALLLIHRVGIDAECIIREVFNAKSEEYGFPERI